MRILIHGAGIAGPTLAWWLQRSGHEVLLAEQAPQLRTGGYVIDFWGVGYEIADRMGLVPRIRERGYQVREVRFVDASGRKVGGFGTGVFARTTGGRFTSVRRSDLSAIVYEALAGHVETLFGDSVRALKQGPHGVDVEFAQAAPRQFDLVVGTDGLHSRVRELVFGPEADFEVALGYHVAAFEVEGYRPRDELVYLSHGAPGRQVSRFSMRDDKTLCLLVFRDEYLPPGGLATDHERKEALAQVFAGMGWEVPQILQAMRQAGDLYFDRVSQIRMDRWTDGCVALAGDAAAAVSLMAGEGTRLAMLEAYVLAGELHAGGGDIATALARYEARLLPFLRRKQASAARFASSFAPATRPGLIFRNLVTRTMGIGAVADWFVGRELRDDIQLPAYWG
jgi:2-polyprenyl-6-methoxyphenol hydroxylase-like FAD-dependent oxidoreductase